RALHHLATGLRDDGVDPRRDHGRAAGAEGRVERVVDLGLHAERLEYLLDAECQRALRRVSVAGGLRGVLAAPGDPRSAGARLEAAAGADGLVYTAQAAGAAL